MKSCNVAIIDIGKTNAKLALVDANLSELAIVTRPNKILNAAPYPHFDVENIWTFILETLTAFRNEHEIDAISVTTHGASGALLAADGALAAPILDYEFNGPETLTDEYDAIRPSFEETGSPRLPLGLNLGAQLHWQFSQFPNLRERTARIVTYPQYWGFRLTGALASDLCSLGCHTDLWDPFKSRYSSLIERLEIAEKMVPARQPTDVIGSILPSIADQTGLDAATPVLCGIHDSNASLLPHVLHRQAPFSVVSTGTWTIAMTVGGTPVQLDPNRDTLVNVNALGQPVPSARFMGGREYEMLHGEQQIACEQTILDSIADGGPMLLPSVVTGSGPFPGDTCRWLGIEPEFGTPEREASIGFYLALMTTECLSLTGHRGDVVVEGPFGKNRGYCSMLSAATECRVVISDNATGTSQGAAMLFNRGSEKSISPDAKTVLPEAQPKVFANYADRWKEAVSRAL